MAENNNKQENIILCGANSYQQKYYFNEKFKLLPENIKKELQIMCVLFTEDVGGILFLVSDAILALIFFSPIREKSLPTWNLITYYAAQILLALSIAVG